MAVERFLRYPELKPLGVPFSREWLNKLIARGQFPAAVALSANTIAWRETDIAAWLANRPLALPAALNKKAA